MIKNFYLRYTLWRILQAVVTILLVYVIVFLILTVLPGDPISNRLRNPQSGYTEDQIQVFLQYYGLDKPVFEQLFLRLGSAFTGDFGLSLTDSRPVWDVVSVGIPYTVQLASMAFVFAVIIAILVVLGSRYLPTRFVRNLFRSFPSLFLSFPNFLLGLIFIQFFSFTLGWFTVINQVGWDAAIFPALSLAIPVSAPIAQVLLAGLDSAEQQPFSVVALSKVLSGPGILVKHLIKPASLPVLTISGLVVGDLLAGSILTEYVFGRQGLGTILLKAATNQDVPVLQAVVLLISAIFIVINLVVDLLYTVLDPRVKLQATR